MLNYDKSLRQKFDERKKLFAIFFLAASLAKMLAPRGCFPNAGIKKSPHQRKNQITKTNRKRDVKSRKT